MENKEILIKEIKLLDKEKETLKKQSINYDIINKMLSIEGGKSLDNYLKNNNLNDIIIYGAGTIAKVLFDLIKHKVNIKVIIDAEVVHNFNFDNIDIINYKDVYKLKYDKIIITPVYAYDQIKKQFEEKSINNFVSIADVINIYTFN